MLDSEGSADSDDPAWLDLDSLVTTTVLPVSTLGALNVDLPAKYEATLASIKLDIGVGERSILRKYSHSVISYCADYGTESLFVEVATICGFVSVSR